MNASETEDCAAVIVAGGASQRMGFDKILIPLAARPLICHTVEAFEQCPAVKEIVVVCAREREAAIREALKNIQKISRFVPGGETRQESVSNGLDAVDPGVRLVAVHDAARPLVTPDLVARCIQAARDHGAATAAEPLTDTLQRGDDEARSVEVVPRENLWRIQTPQVFAAADLKRAVADVMRAGVSVTDETSAVQRIGGAVFLVENTDWNFKVTFPRDVPVAEFILQSRAASSFT